MYSVGELARQTGVTVRSLHHYEEVGLLQPSARSEAGYRLYTESDARRLHRLLAYKHLGLSLKEILSLMQDGEPPLRELLEKQKAAVQARIAQQQRVLDLLNWLARDIGETGDESASEDEARIDIARLMDTMQAMQASDQYFSKDELKKIWFRRAELGEAKLRDLRAQWENLVPRVRAAMQARRSTSEPAVQALAREWWQLAHAFSGGDMALFQRIGEMYRDDKTVQKFTGVDADMILYIGMAFRAAGLVEEGTGEQHA